MLAPADLCLPLPDAPLVVVAPHTFAALSASAGEVLGDAEEVSFLPVTAVDLFALVPVAFADLFVWTLATWDLGVLVGEEVLNLWAADVCVPSPSTGVALDTSVSNTAVDLFPAFV